MARATVYTSALPGTDIVLTLGVLAYFFFRQFDYFFAFFTGLDAGEDVLLFGKVGILLE